MGQPQQPSSWPQLLEAESRMTSSLSDTMGTGCVAHEVFYRAGPQWADCMCESMPGFPDLV